MLQIIKQKTFLKLKKVYRQTNNKYHKRLLVCVYHSMAQIIKREELVIARDGVSE